MKSEALNLEVGKKYVDVAMFTMYLKLYEDSTYDVCSITDDDSVRR